MGISLGLDRLRDFTFEFVDLKQKFFPGLFRPSCTRLDRILKEIKGSEIRSAFQARSGKGRFQRTYAGFLDSVFDLVERYECKIFGRVWIKSIGTQSCSWGTYISSVQFICSTFQHLLSTRATLGCVIVDPRRPAQNRRVSYSIFTQKFEASGDPYPQIIEMPTFGQPENHAGVQVADLLCSGVLVPIAAYSYCLGYVSNIHVTSRYQFLKNRYASRLKNLQYCYTDRASGETLGGIVTSDPLGMRDRGHLFRT